MISTAIPTVKFMIECTSDKRQTLYNTIHDAKLAYRNFKLDRDQSIFRVYRIEYKELEEIKEFK
jgi:hypothetical protein